MLHFYRLYVFLFLKLPPRGRAGNYVILTFSYYSCFVHVYCIFFLSMPISWYSSSGSRQHSLPVFRILTIDWWLVAWCIGFHKISHLVATWLWIDTKCFLCISCVKKKPFVVIGSSNGIQGQKQCWSESGA